MSVVELPKGEAADAPFTIGDVVQLRSGGVLVTVRQVTRKAKGVVTVTVDWMDASDTLNSAKFDARQLETAPTKEAQGDD